MDKKKIKILDTKYIKDKDLVYWEVIIIDEEKSMSLAMYGKDMLAGFGILDNVEHNQMLEFLDMIKGKQLEWQTESTITAVPDLNNDDSVYNAIKEIEKFPFEEVEEEEKNI